MTKPTFRELLSRPIHMLAFGLGTGLSPAAPGTMGTLLGVAIYWLMSPLPLTIYVVLVVIGLIAGVWICDVTASNLGVHDHPGIVWDEVIGFLVTMTALPASWPWVAAGFVLFRLFDIVKPWPIRVLDRKIQGGLGIMIDDIAAGLAALGILHIARFALS